MTPQVFDIIEFIGKRNPALLVQIRAELPHVFEEDDEEGDPLPPMPDDVALAAFQGLLASGKYAENQNVAATTAWQLVAEFYRARNWYATVLAPALMGGSTSDADAASENEV